MNIAFFSEGPFSKTLGASKNRIELAESLSELGWETELIDPEGIGLAPNLIFERATYAEALKNYLIKNAYKHDVVLYEYYTLPFDRDLFSKNTLFVARPALLGHHFQTIKIPKNFKAKASLLKTKIVNILVGRKTVSAKEEQFIYMTSLKNCDVIQVQNNKDFEALTNLGFSKNKIIIVPNGISDERLKLFESIERSFEAAFKIAFVGTFDFRKGAMDFPFIVQRVLKDYPETQFKFLGTKGLFKTIEEVLAFFPKKYHSHIEVKPTFDPLELPELLTDCHIGIFPSYIESFGFGALEMMCAGLPVIGYDAPGPADFLLKDLLVPIGDKQLLAEKVALLLKNKELLVAKSKESKEVSKRYKWSIIASDVDKIYKQRLALLEKNAQ
jgi:glycosyltransferase involved in cell wall biosynthesis